MRRIQLIRGPLSGNHCIAFNFNSSLRFLNLQIYCIIALRTPLSKYGAEKWWERKQWRRLSVLLCFDVSCQASRSRQLVQEISKLEKIIYHLGINTNQSRKLLTFLLDTSARQKLHIIIGQRSNTLDLISGHTH